MKFLKKDIVLKGIPLFIILTSGTLFVLVLIISVQNFYREKRYMKRVLKEKGAVLIRAFEAGSRAGLMHMGWGPAQLQSMIEAFSQEPGINYIYITDNKGLIVAHSNPKMIGLFIAQKFLERLTPKDVKVRIKKQDKTTIFEVYKLYTPFAVSCSVNSKGMRSFCFGRNFYSKGNYWCSPKSLLNSDYIIWVGLDPTPYEAAIREDIKNSLISSAMLLILGIGGIFSFFIVNKYYTTKRTLQDIKAFSHEVISNIPTGIIMVSNKDKVIFLNRSAEKIMEIKASKVIGESLEKSLFKEFSLINKKLNKYGIILDEEITIKIQSHQKYLKVSGVKIHNENGIYIGKAFILKDETKVKKLQEEVKTKEKLAALGELASGIAHEIRNPLSSIKGLATFFYEKFCEKSEEKEAAEVMIHEVERLNRVVSELLEFARPSELRIKKTNIKNLIEHCLKLIQQDIRTKNIKIDYVCENEVYAEIDPDRMAQCLLNLLVNGIEAMERGGKLSIDLNQEKGYLKIKIKDTGKGIPEKDLNKIFDPYFTTKPSGTGLGLAIVYKIVEAHHGKIEVFSKVGWGSEFIITLPQNIDMKNKQQKNIVQKQ